MSAGRRKFLQQAGLASVGLLGTGLLPKRIETRASTRRGSWSFVHYTDVHVQPELRADEGYRQAVRAMNHVKPKPVLAIAGGDLVFDVFENGFERADKLYRMYAKITQGLNMPVYQAIGNHDIFGIDPIAGVSENHPEHGKKMFASRVGNGSTYRSFDFQDWHFVLLDSVSVTLELGYEGRIDQQQFDWLQKDLKSVGTQRPVVLVSHIPFFSILPMMLNGPTEAVSPSLTITNSKEVLGFCSDYNVRLILQGHVHIVENHQYKKMEYVTSGAVCGNWWKGPRMGHPEGFAVYTIEGGQVQWSYHSYGWHAMEG